MSKRCEATNINGKRCKRHPPEGKNYCQQHQSIIIDCTDVKQKDAVYFPREENGPGLLQELWKIIGHRLTLLQIRPLYLACKTLFGMFTSEDWYRSYHRYICIETTNKRDKLEYWLGKQN